jgi:hypothetical protein
MLKNHYFRVPLMFRRYVLTENLASALLSINFEAWRATSMTTELFRNYCERADLKCVSQELIGWGRASA